MKPSSDITNNIKTWRQRLIDLTHRNRLVFFNPKSPSVTEIVEPPASELFDSMVLSNKSFYFDTGSIKGVMEEGEHELPPASKRGYIKTSVELDNMGKLLRRLIRNHTSYKQEQGLHTMFLAIGMVHWKEANQSNEEALSPVILLPVQIELDKTKDRYFLKMADEDIVVNPALRFKFETERGIGIQDLPEDIDWNSARSYLLNLRKKISHLDWTVDEKVWLSRFHFEKFAMYKELEQHEVEIVQHPLLKAIAKPDTFPIPLSDRILSDIDSEIDPREVFTVLDADSSQLEVIFRASKGENLVVYGPPGTGKSQTIVNVISQLLIDGKRVLFVSEKMAALEVVYGKLKHMGLDFACLELHSHKSNKSKIIEEIGKTIRDEHPSHGERGDDEKFAQLRRLRLRLNDYVKALHNKTTALDTSPYRVIERLSKLGPAIHTRTGLLPEDILKVTAEDLSQKLMSLRRLSVDTPLWRDFESNPWKLTRLDIQMLTIEGRRDLLKHVSTLNRSTDECINLLDKTGKTLGINVPSRLADIMRLIRFLDNLGKADVFCAPWHFKTENELNQLRTNLVTAEDKTKRYIEVRNRLETNFNIGILDLPIDTIADHFKGTYRSIFRFLFRQYREDKAKLKGLSKSPMNLEYNTIVKSLEDAIQIRNYNSYIEGRTPYFQEELGVMFQRLNTDWGKARNSLDWFTANVWKNELISEPNKLLNFASSPNILSQIASNLNEQLRQTHDIILESLRNINSYSENNQGVDIFRLDSLDDLRKASGMAHDENRLDSYVQFFRLQEECEKLGLSEFINQQLAATNDPMDIERKFEFGFYTEWLNIIIDRTPILRDFNPAFHLQNISRFKELDKDLIEEYARIVEWRCRDRQPKRQSAMASGSEVSTLLREASKKRRHMPIRRLFEQTTKLILDLKPCILMSPLSVSTYLPRRMKFDVVIFDEASQIKPEDAIGAISRGKSLIVVGDDKQLPPTTFFESAAADEGIEDDDNETLESILDECKASTSFREMRLRWHYRSRYEELIAFSNRYFYDNDLVTFPSPYPTGMSKAVTLIEVKNGVYDRGGTRTNRNEAIKVVDIIVDHVKLRGNSMSLGVVTFSVAQEEAILDEIEHRTKKEPELSVLNNSDVNEPFFVKSLEKVQGDERDYIVISVGYGRDLNGTVSMNFGPLNKIGGERRLNVAITRARLRTTVVTSLSKADIRLDQSTPKNDGITILKDYLDYARESGVFKEEYVSKGLTESPFEEKVKIELQRRGYEVDSQVGASGFRIDLGVKDPNSPDRYLLGIECDGASYHSSRTARDRDRLRQEVLEQLGWKIHRIWSTDWFRRPGETIDALVHSIDDLIEVNKGKDGEESRIEAKRRELPRTRKPVTSEDISGNGNTAQHEKKGGSENTYNNSALPKYRYSVHKRYAPRWIGKRMPSDLFLAANDKDALGILKNDIMYVVKIEAPIHFDALIERISLIYSVGRSQEKALDAIKLAIKSLKEAKKISTAKDAFVIWSRLAIMEPRTPKDGEEPRPIEEVPLIEIVAAVRKLSSLEYSMPIDSLVEGAAKMLGYKRIGTVITSRIGKAIDFAVSKGLIIDEHGIIHTKP